MGGRREHAGNALELVLAQVRELEARPEQPPRRVGNHHLAGRRDPLQARCKVRGVTDYRLLLRRTLAD